MVDLRLAVLLRVNTLIGVLFAGSHQKFLAGTWRQNHIFSGSRLFVSLKAGSIFVC